MITIDDFWLTFLIATILPAIVAFVTKRFADSVYGAITLLFLSVISGWLTSLNATPDHSFDLKTAFIAIVTTFITAVVTHFGLLKPARITGSGGVVQKAQPAGIGSEPSSQF
jgi:hypothetical protein